MHLLASTRLDVDVDVRGAVARRRQEPLEEQPERHRVGVGHPERVADGRVRGRASPLAEDALAAAELRDVPDDEEVPRVPELTDDRELVVELGPRARDALARPRPVPLGRPHRDQLGEVALLVEPVGRREVRESRGDQAQVERALERELRGALDDAGEACEAPRLLGGASAGTRRAPARSSPPCRRRSVGARGPPRGCSRAGRRPVSRSGRCWSRPRRRPLGWRASASASLRAASSGSPWSHSSTATFAVPTASTSRSSSRRASRGPCVDASARGTGPLRQPVSTSQWPPWRSASAVEVDRRAPLLAEPRCASASSDDSAA